MGTTPSDVTPTPTRESGMVHYSVQAIITLLAVLLVLFVFSWSNTVYDYPTNKNKVSEAQSLSAPARTSLGVLCSEGKLRPGLRNKDPEVGLVNPELYSGQYVKSVTISVPEQNSGKIVVVFKRIGDEGWFGNEGKTYVDDGATLIYRGLCDARGTEWFLDPASTVPKKYWPRFPVYEVPVIVKIPVDDPVLLTVNDAYSLALPAVEAVERYIGEHGVIPSDGGGLSIDIAAVQSAPQVATIEIDAAAVIRITLAEGQKSRLPAELQGTRILFVPNRKLSLGSSAVRISYSCLATDVLVPYLPADCRSLRSLPIGFEPDAQRPWRRVGTPASQGGLVLDCDPGDPSHDLAFNYGAYDLASGLSPGPKSIARDLLIIVFDIRATTHDTQAVLCKLDAQFAESHPALRYYVIQLSQPREPAELEKQAKALQRDFRVRLVRTVPARWLKQARYLLPPGRDDRFKPRYPDGKLRFTDEEVLAEYESGIQSQGTLTEWRRAGIAETEQVGVYRDYEQARQGDTGAPVLCTDDDTIPKRILERMKQEGKVARLTQTPKYWEVRFVEISGRGERRIQHRRVVKCAYVKLFVDTRSVSSRDIKGGWAFGHPVIGIYNHPDISSRAIKELANYLWAQDLRRRADIVPLSSTVTKTATAINVIQYGATRKVGMPSNTYLLTKRTLGVDLASREIRLRYEVTRRFTRANKKGNDTQEMILVGTPVIPSPRFEPDKGNGQLSFFAVGGAKPVFKPNGRGWASQVLGAALEPAIRELQAKMADPAVPYDTQKAELKLLSLLNQTYRVELLLRLRQFPGQFEVWVRGKSKQARFVKLVIETAKLLAVGKIPQNSFAAIRFDTQIGLSKRACLEQVIELHRRLNFSGNPPNAIALADNPTPYLHPLRRAGWRFHIHGDRKSPPMGKPIETVIDFGVAQQALLEIAQSNPLKLRHRTPENTKRFLRTLDIANYNVGVVSHAWITATSPAGRLYQMDPWKGHVRRLKKPTFSGSPTKLTTQDPGDWDGSWGSDLRYFPIEISGPRYEYFVEP